MEKFKLARENKLKKIQDKSTILSLISGAKESDYEIYIWRFIGPAKFVGEMRIEAFRKSSNDFCIVPRKDQEEIVQKILQGQNYIDLYIPDSLMVFRSIIKSSFAPYRYYLKIPSFIGQINRRKGLRLKLYETADKIQISFKKTLVKPPKTAQAFNKQCFDIAEEGFSFLISKIESKFFQVGDLISEVKIVSHDKTMTGEAKIVALREVNPDEFNSLAYKVWRVSCKFTQPDQLRRKYLERYIFERIKGDMDVISNDT